MTTLAPRYTDLIGTPQGVITSGMELSSLITSISTEVSELIINQNITVSSSLTTPATLAIRMIKGAKITVASGQTLKIDGQFECGLYQAFDGDGTVIFGKGAVNGVYSEWWGAVPDGVTDCQPAITKATQSLLNVNSEAILLNFASGNYYLDSPVIMYWQNYTNSAGIRFQGTTALSNYNYKGTVITGKAAIDSMFIHRALNITTSYFMSFQCHNITFISGSFGTTGPKSAILVLGGGQSSRPFIVEECYLRGFGSAIKADMSTSGLSTSICDVVIRKNFFINNTLAYEGVGNSSTVGIDFSNNQAGTGGGVKFTCDGTFRICDNIMESNTDSIIVTGGLYAGEVMRNYFEANSGVLASFSATAPKSTVVWKNNFITLSSGTSVVASDIVFHSPQVMNSYGVKLKLSNTRGKSTINNSSILYPANIERGTVSLDLYSVSLNSALPPAALTDGGYQSVSGSTEKTPIGTASVYTVNGTGTLYTYASNPVSGDWMVFQCLARTRVNTAGGFYIEMLNNAETASIGISNTNYYFNDVGIGDWVYVLIYIQATGNSGGNVKWRYYTDSGTEVDVTSTYVYKVAAPTLTTPLYLTLPAV